MAIEQRRARLSIDVPREARRRIHIAAASRDQSIRAYVWEAVEARLNQDLVDEPSAGDLVALTEQGETGEDQDKPEPRGNPEPPNRCGTRVRLAIAEAMYPGMGPERSQIWLMHGARVRDSVELQAIPFGGVSDRMRHPCPAEPKRCGPPVEFGGRMARCFENARSVPDLGPRGD